MSTLLGIDVGGTFTDVIARTGDGATVIIDKVSSTPDDPSRSVIAAVGRLRDVHGVELSSVELFAHGSTVATNALLESELPRTALIVTSGFRDVLEIGTQRRTEMFDLTLQKRPPLVPRELVFELSERVSFEGEVVHALDDAEIDRVAGEIAAAGVDACAVCLLFSIRNSDHEDRMAAALQARLPGVSVAVSSAVAPEIKEYPRSCTTTLAAALRPLVAGYVARIERGVAEAGVGCGVHVMQSSGGVVPGSDAGRLAHHMILSGPAAGVIAASRLADTGAYPNQITFDMGGTSTDICLIHDGVPRIDREPVFDGWPLLVPQVDIHTIGSGGGSIAWVDSGGLLHAGPQSAGAAPGPACYGRGGTLPTVTDAHLVLGRLAPGRFLDGEMQLDLDAATTAVAGLAEELGLTVDEAALGILEVADAVMARGVRVVSVNRGHDPRDFALVGYGGAGPMHAASAGRLVEVGEIVIPPYPGAFSALGLVGADVRRERTRVIELPVDHVTGADVERWLGEIGSELVLDDAGGSPQRVARLRYAAHDDDIEVPLPDGPITQQDVDGAVARFHELHEFTYGYATRDARVELVALRVEKHRRLPRFSFAPREPGSRGAPPAAEVRRACFAETGWTDTPVYRRADLAPGTSFAGPAVVEEREATTIVPPAAVASIDELGCIVIRFPEDER